ncbi:MAG: DAK2 domain-containing protein [Actinomycetia bacterium]|nr:DAK2 domain-containing protein [Actinomycetes bacterium]
MTDRIPAAALVEAVLRVKAAIGDLAPMLDELDAVAGDGDLGLTHRLAFRAIAGPETIQAPTWGGVLARCAALFGSAAASTYGVTLSTGLEAAAAALEDVAAAGLADLVRAFGAAVDAVRRTGGADEGDKTVLDALIPAWRALQAAEAQGLTLPVALKQAVEAAQAGAERTRALQPRTGRASWNATRSVGHVDPGAFAVALILKTGVDALA